MCGTGVSGGGTYDEEGPAAGKPSGVSDVAYTYGAKNFRSNQHPSGGDDGNQSPLPKKQPTRYATPPPLPGAEDSGGELVASAKTYIDPFGNIQQGVGRNPLSVGTDEWSRIANNPLLASAFRAMPGTGGQLGPRQFTSRGAVPTGQASPLEYFFGSKIVGGDTGGQLAGRGDTLRGGMAVEGSNLGSVEQQAGADMQGGQPGIGIQSWGQGSMGAGTNTTVVPGGAPPGSHPQSSVVSTEGAVGVQEATNQQTEEGKIAQDVAYLVATGSDSREPRMNELGFVPGTPGGGSEVGTVFERGLSEAERTAPLYQPPRRSWGNAPIITA